MATKKRSKPKPKAPKKPHGRPAYVPKDEDRGAVASLIAFGLGEERVSDYLGIATMTLRKHFAPELKKSRIQLMGRSMTGLVKALNNDEEWAIKFVLRTLGKNYGWTERVEHTGPNGGSIPHRISTLNDAQLEQLLSRLEPG